MSPTGRIPSITGRRAPQLVSSPARLNCLSSKRQTWMSRPLCCRRSQSPDVFTSTRTRSITSSSSAISRGTFRSTEAGIAAPLRRFRRATTAPVQGSVGRSATDEGNTPCVLGARARKAHLDREEDITMATETPATIPPKMKMTTNIPAEITTPDSVETSLGTLRFFDGLPDKATVEKVFDNLDFMRGMDVFLNTTAATSTLANIEGLKSVGCNNQTVVIHENRVDAKTLLLTPNTQTATLWGFTDLKDGPLVVEIPP